MIRVACLGVVALIIGCGPQNAPKPEVSSTQTSKKIRVALITPGPADDDGWNELAKVAADNLKTEGLASEISHSVANGLQAQTTMANYGKAGVDLVFGHGYEYNAMAKAVHAESPKTYLVSMSGDFTAPNVGVIRFYDEQAFYLAGMLAALQSKTGSIGAVGVAKIPSIVSTFDAFAAGAKAAKPSIRVLPPVYFGVEGDVAKARLATQAVIAAGADFVVHQANSAAQGVFDVCRERKVLAIGANGDQRANTSGVVVATTFIDARPAFARMAKNVISGTQKGETLLIGLKDGAVDFKIEPRYESSLSSAVKARLKEAKGKLIDGSLVAPRTSS